MASKEMLTAISKATFALSMSCSEGITGSVIQLMSNGLVPIITKYDNIDHLGKGFIINKLTIQELDATIQHALSTPIEKIEQMSLCCSQYIMEEHTSKVFKQKLSQHLSGITRSNY